ncbi:MAG: hypothetical protein HRT53_16755 [Colwellia sp.]|nr:hypothetical protein [Colwellia sp.]
MINNINAYSSNYNINTSNSATAEIDEIIEAHKKSNTPIDEAASSQKENLYLSSRAKKINAISSEFFSNGAMNFNDVNALKERAYELGLISKQEYARLTDTKLTDADKNHNTEVSSQTLANFAGDFVERLDKAGVDDSDTETDSKSLLALKEALTTAKKILSDVDKAKNDPSFKESLESTLFSIRETISADTFEILPLDDRAAISKVYQAIEIIDKISHKRLSNAKVDRYIQVSFD